MPIKKTELATGHFVIIRANTQVNITLCHKQAPLEEVQAAIGGYAERVPHITDFQWNGEPAQMFVNENGLPLGLPINRIATQLLRDAYPDRHMIPIVGDVVLLTGNARWK